MSDETGPSAGELLFEYTPMVTQVVEYGASFEAIASRPSPPPAEGAPADRSVRSVDAWLAQSRDRAIYRPALPGRPRPF
jgi:hypothetical protein